MALVPFISVLRDSSVGPSRRALLLRSSSFANSINDAISACVIGLVIYDVIVTLKAIRSYLFVLRYCHIVIENEKQLTRQAIALLDSIEIDMDRLQAEKQKKLPPLTNTQFAELLGVKTATYSDYKNSKQAKPSLPVALRAALILDFDLRLVVPRRIH